MQMVIAAILGGFLRRVYGGGLGIAKIYALVPMTILAGYLAYLDGGIVLGLLVGAVSVPFWTMGHGSYMDMGTMPGKDNERFHYVLDYIMGEEVKPSFWRDFVGMMMRYSTPAFFIGAMYALLGMWHGLLIILVGPVIACGYALMMRLRTKLVTFPPFIDGFTAYGEVIAGATFYAALVLI